MNNCHQTCLKKNKANTSVTTKLILPAFFHALTTLHCHEEYDVVDSVTYNHTNLLKKLSQPHCNLRVI